MGRFVKNREIKTGSYSVRLPIGSNTIGPDVPVPGLFRYNQNTTKLEYFANNVWNQVESDLIGRELFKDTFYGDGTTKIFGPMRYAYDTGQELLLLVYIGNVHQNPGVAYRVENDSIEFTSPPPDGHAIVIIHGLAR